MIPTLNLSEAEGGEFESGYRQYRSEMLTEQEKNLDLLGMTPAEKEDFLLMLYFAQMSIARGFLARNAKTG